MGKGKPKKDFNDSSSEANDNSAKPLTDNPLANPPALPHGTFPFDQVETKHFLPALKWAVKKHRAEIDAIIENPDLPSFANTIEALEFSGVDLDRATSVFSNFTGTRMSKELRAQENVIRSLLTKHGNDIGYDDALFARIEAVYKNKDNLNLDPEQAMLLEDTYKSFIRRGIALNPKQKDRLKKISERLSQIRTQYRNNILEDKAEYKKIIENESELAGVPQRAKNIYKQAAEDKGLTGKWLIPLEPYPSGIMDYAENRDLRKEIYTAYKSLASQGGRNNKPLVMKIVKLRHERAKILGYNNHADFILSERMAGSPRAVNEFLEKNLNTYKPVAEKEFEAIKDYARKKDGITDFEPWDFSYYHRTLQEETFSINLEELRPYFQLDAVLEGMRNHAEKLFNINLEDKTDQYPTHHPDIKVYEVQDNESGETIGLFYADYYARPGEKRGGAWMNALRNRGIHNGENAIPIITNTCNFDKPTATQPSLLSLREVQTVFHEFGHGLHGLLAEGRYPSLTGTNVKWDFVELPSQLQENWVQKKEVLDTFAKHYKTGAPIPAETVKKINDMENFSAGMTGLGQTSLAMLDMAWHSTDPAKIKNVDDLEKKINAKTSLYKKETPGSRSATFSHLFAGGYAAGYYSYKWAEVLEADVFAEFQREGLYDRNTAKRLRETIYSKGGTREPMDLFKAMMGREPDPKALFRREGLLDENKGNKPGNDNNNDRPAPGSGPS